MKFFTQPPKDFNFSTQASICCVHHQDKILILRHSSKKPLWGIPGGKREENEAPRETALRELKEETGISLTHNDITKVGQVYIRRPELDFVFHMFQTRLSKPTAVTLSQEHNEYQWVTTDEFQKLPLYPGGLEAFQHYQKSLLEQQQCKAMLDAQLVPIKNNQVTLALRQNTGYYDNHYGLIGGKVDPLESTFNALIREVKEEAGVTIASEQVSLIHTRHHYRDRNSVSIFFSCTGWNGEFINQEPHKCGGFATFPLDDIPSNTVPYVAEVIKHIRNNIPYSEGGWPS